MEFLNLPKTGPIGPKIKKNTVNTETTENTVQNEKQEFRNAGHLLACRLLCVKREGGLNPPSRI